MWGQHSVFFGGNKLLIAVLSLLKVAWTLNSEAGAAKLISQQLHS